MIKGFYVNENGVANSYENGKLVCVCGGWTEEKENFYEENECYDADDLIRALEDVED